MTEAIAGQYVCSFCNRCFRKHEHLQRHRRIHTNEKPYNCECGLSFSRQDLLQRHRRISPCDQRQHATSYGNINAYGSHDRVRPTRKDRNSQDRAPQFSIEVERTLRSSSCGILEQRRVSPTAHQFAQEPISTPETTLPLPPEYADLECSYLRSQPEKHVLADFENFFRTSGLQQIADDLSRTQRHGLNDTRNSLMEETLSNASDHCLSLPTQDTARRKTQTPMTDQIQGSWSNYEQKCPDLVPPSARACARYLTSYVKNSRVPLFHNNVQIYELDPVTKFALYALGAIHLYEVRNAMSLFTTSRHLAFQRWTSDMDNSREKPSQSLTPSDALIAYHFLAEFLKVAQPVDVVREFEICATAISFYSRLWRFHFPTDQRPVKSDPNSTRAFQCSRIIVLCSLVLDGFLLGFSVATQSDDLKSTFKCPLSSLLSHDSVGEGGEQSRELFNTGDIIALFDVLAHEHDNELGNCIPDSESILSKFPPDVHFVLLSFIILRIRMDKDASMLGISSEILALERTRLLLTLSKIVRLLRLQMSSMTASPTVCKAQSNYSFACLVHLRAVCPLDLNYATDPSQLVASLKAIKPKFEEQFSRSLLQCIEHCLELLEEPASTGLLHYVRQQASSWGLETVLWAFESAIFLSKWIQKYTAVASSVKEGEVYLGY
ncbi:hypothetical protein CaCOL14_005026 [Colletotrichum acutatum]